MYYENVWFYTGGKAGSYYSVINDAAVTRVVAPEPVQGYELLNAYHLLFICMNKLSIDCIIEFFKVPVHVNLNEYLHESILLDN